MSRQSDDDNRDRYGRPTRRWVLAGGLAAPLTLGAMGLGGAALAGLKGGTHRLVRRSATAFGTTVSITLVDNGRFDCDAALAEGFAVIRSVERAANLFDPDSELCRLNRTGILVSPSPDFCALISAGLILAEASGGAFDPSVQPVWQLWRETGGTPPAEALTAVRQLVDFRAVEVGSNQVRLLRPQMALTFNALAQGLATDRVAAVLAAHGAQAAFLDTGELGARGTRPDGQAWRVGIAAPRDRDGPGTFDLASQRFVATSADNATFWRPDFSEHHIIEPWSGHSPRELAEVVVIAPSGLMADGLSTAAMVLGRERAADLLRQMPSTAALFIDKTGEVTTTGNFPALT